jgi:hypothetical protein
LAGADPAFVKGVRVYVIQVRQSETKR